MRIKRRNLPDSMKPEKPASEGRVSETEELIAQVGNQLLKKLETVKKAVEADPDPKPSAWVFQVDYDGEGRITKIVATPDFSYRSKMN